MQLIQVLNHTDDVEVSKTLLNEAQARINSID